MRLPRTGDGWSPNWPQLVESLVDPEIARTSTSRTSRRVVAALDPRSVAAPLRRGDRLVFEWVSTLSDRREAAEVTFEVEEVGTPGAPGWSLSRPCRRRVS